MGMSKLIRIMTGDQPLGVVPDNKHPMTHLDLVAAKLPPCSNSVRLKDRTDLNSCTTFYRKVHVLLLILVWFQQEKKSSCNCHTEVDKLLPIPFASRPSGAASSSGCQKGPLIWTTVQWNKLVSVKCGPCNTQVSNEFDVSSVPMLSHVPAR